jgi:DNA polymerase III delta prime subunit
MLKASSKTDESVEPQVHSASSSLSLPFAEKYRPRALDDVKGHTDALKYLKRCLAMRVVPHLLFVGPPGVGKTTCALCFAREYLADLDHAASFAVSSAAVSKPAAPKTKQLLDTTNSRLLVLNASLLRTPRAVSDRIGAFLDKSDESSTLRLNTSSNADQTSKHNKPQNTKRVVVCDEVDSMTVAAHQALRSLLASYNDRAIFILTCNKLECVSEALQSLCFIVNFKPLEIMQAAEVVASVAHREGIEVTLDGIRALVSVARGDLRAAMNALQTSASRGTAASAAFFSLNNFDVAAAVHQSKLPFSEQQQTQHEQKQQQQTQHEQNISSSSSSSSLPVNKKTVYDTSDIPLPAKMEKVLETSCSNQPRDALAAVEKYHCVAGHSIEDMLFVLQHLVTDAATAATPTSPVLAKVLSGSFLTVVLEHLELAKQAPATLLQLQACLARISASYLACFL